MYLYVLLFSGTKRSGLYPKLVGLRRNRFSQCLFADPYPSYDLARPANQMTTMSAAPEHLGQVQLNFTPLGGLPHEIEARQLVREPPFFIERHHVLQAVELSVLDVDQCRIVQHGLHQQGA
jgi:hypothetical protein